MMCVFIRLFEQGEEFEEGGAPHQNMVVHIPLEADNNT
jgi:hypothetical protein